MDLRTLTLVSHSLQALRLVPLIAAWVHFGTGRFRREPALTWLLAYLLADAVLECVLLSMAVRSIRTYGLLDLTIVPSFAMQAAVLVRLRPSRRLGRALVAAGVVLALVSGWEGWQGGLQPKWAWAMALSSLVVLGTCLWVLFQELADDRGDSLARRPAFWVATSWMVEQGSGLLLTACTGFFLRTLSRAWIGIPWITHDLICAVLTFTLARAFLCPKPTSS